MNTLQRWIILGTIGFGGLSGLPASAYAGWLKDRIKDVKKLAAKLPPVPSPLPVQLDIVLGTPPKVAVGDFIESQGKNLGSIARTTRTVSAELTRPVSEAVAQVGGKYGTIAYEIVTASERLQREFLFTGAEVAGATLRGQDPLVSLAMPLAAAVRDARAQFDSQATPLPSELVELLAPVIPRVLLHRARYAQGDLKIALPNIINRGQVMFGDASGHAVTIDDIIVFSKVPGFDSEDDIVWWAHEIHHVHQYSTWGVDQFAFNYLKHSGRVEAEADHAGEFVRSYLRKLPAQGPILPEAGFSMMRSYVAQSIATPLGQSQVFVEAASPAVTAPSSDRCIVYGEEILVGQDGLVRSLTAGGIRIGTKLYPASPACVFDLFSERSGRRYCVVRPSGYVLTGSPATAMGVPIEVAGTAIGRCARCDVVDCR